MKKQPYDNQLLMLNWSKWLSHPDVKLQKVPVRASQKGTGKIKFEAFFVAETDEVIMRFGRKPQTNRMTMYLIAKKRK